MTSAKSILFLCVANSARSQMAEGLARKLFGDARPRPERRQRALAREPLRHRGDARAGHRSHDAPLQVRATPSIPATVDTVITLCAEEVCPVFLGKARRLHWPIPDPASDDPTLSRDELLARFRTARDTIRGMLERFEG